MKKLNIEQLENRLETAGLVVNTCPYSLDIQGVEVVVIPK